MHDHCRLLFVVVCMPNLLHYRLNRSSSNHWNWTLMNPRNYYSTTSDPQAQDPPWTRLPHLKWQQKAKNINIQTHNTFDPLHDLLTLLPRLLSGSQLSRDILEPLFQLLLLLGHLVFLGFTRHLFICKRKLEAPNAKESFSRNSYGDRLFWECQVQKKLYGIHKRSSSKRQETKVHHLMWQIRRKKPF